MQFFWEVTRGDSLYREVPFVDQYGNAVDLTNWNIEANFKKAYSDRKPYFTLALGNGGLSFSGSTPQTGILRLLISPDQFDDLDLTAMPRNGEFVPFKFVYGDIKLVPPSGTEMTPDGGSRPNIVLKILASVTP